MSRRSGPKSRGPESPPTCRHRHENILLDISEKPRVPFRYLDKGIMAMIGRAGGETTERARRGPQIRA
jgi:hypothetical protein